MNGTFSATVGGRKVSLGVKGPDTPENRARALEAYRRMKAEYEAARKKPGNQADPAGATRNVTSRACSEAVADYLAFAALRHQAGRLGEGALSNYRHALAPFAAEFGPRPVSELVSPDGRLEVEAWCSRRGWSSSYQHTVLGLVQTVFKRAGHPVRFDRPPMESRGPDVVLSDEQFAQVLANLFRRPSTGDLRELLILLRETGRRPQEGARLTAEGIDWQNCCKLAREHKTKRKTGRDALWVFAPAAMAILRKQREKYGSGLLFRTPGGRPYTRRLICNQLLLVSKRVGFRVVAYGLGRHSYANKALEAGLPDVMVAALLGHSSTQMIHKHYSHVAANARAMRAAAERVGGAGRGIAVS